MSCQTNQTDISKTTFNQKLYRKLEWKKKIKNHKRRIGKKAVEIKLNIKGLGIIKSAERLPKLQESKTDGAIQETGNQGNFVQKQVEEPN